MARLKTISGLLALVLLAPALFAAPPAAKPVVKITPVPPVGPSPITPDCRYLFVVDLSAAMQRAADGLYRTTHRLVATGLGGRVQEGDVFTVWTYADTVLTREFPLNAWTPDLNIALANRTYEFLAQQKFRGKSNLRPVFAELGQALAIATNLTVVFISDGTDVIVGTPFDRPINVTYGQRASEMRTARMPFITTLVTQRGEFTQWVVRGGLEDIGLPFPEKPVLPAPVVAQPPPVAPPVPKPALTPPPAVLPVVSAPKPVAPTNPPPPVVATASPPKAPAPAPAPVEKSAPTNVDIKPAPVVTKAPDAAVPKPALVPPPPSASPPVALPLPAPRKSDANLSLPASTPKQEAKAAASPPPKPVIETPKTPTPPAIQPIVPKPKVELVTQPLPPVIPPTPPAKPLAARVIETKPVPPQTSNLTVAVAKPATPPGPTKRVPPTEPKAAVTAEPAPKPAGPLAVASPAPRSGGWAYLAAAVALLVVAGGIIAQLLRPRPHPSVISQSLDDKRG